MRISLLLCLLTVSAFSQECKDIGFLSDSQTINTVSGGSWYQIKAKGDGLLLSLVKKGDGWNVSYVIYKARTCSHVTDKTVPERIQAVDNTKMTKELWRLGEETGACICVTCLKKHRVETSDTLKLIQGAYYLLYVSEMTKSGELQMQWTNVDPLKRTFDLRSKMYIENDMRYTLKSVRFKNSSSDFLNKNYRIELDSLVMFLENNPSVNICIEGHVNGPVQSKFKKYQTLSEQRAESVKKHLLLKGISPVRVTVKGLGNQKMVYPSPRNAAQASRNRRVEVRVIKR